MEWVEKWRTTKTLKELLHRILVALVDRPDDVQVTSTDTEQGTTFLVTVAPTDVGKVIGKGGRTAESLRYLLSAFGMKSKVRYSLDIKVSRQ